MRWMGSWNIYHTQGQAYMYYPEVVDNCALILALHPAPRAVGHPTEVAQCVQIMYAH